MLLHCCSPLRAAARRILASFLLALISHSFDAVFNSFAAAAEDFVSIRAFTLKRSSWASSKWGLVAFITFSIQLRIFSWGPRILSRVSLPRTCELQFQSNHTCIHNISFWVTHSAHFSLLLCVRLWNPYFDWFQKDLADTGTVLHSYCKGNKLQLMAKKTHTNYRDKTCSVVRTSNCIISQTRLRSAIDGWGLPSKNFASPLSHTDSILLRDCTSNFSACFAASGLGVRPREGANAVFSTKVAAQVCKDQKGGKWLNYWEASLHNYAPRNCSGLSYSFEACFHRING